MRSALRSRSKSTMRQRTASLGATWAADKWVPLSVPSCMEGLPDNQGAEVEGRSKYNTPYEKLTSIREFAMVTNLLFFVLPRKSSRLFANKPFNYNICMVEKNFATWELFWTIGTFFKTIIAPIGAISQASARIEAAGGLETPHNAHSINDHRSLNPGLGFCARGVEPFRMLTGGLPSSIAR